MSEHTEKATPSPVDADRSAEEQLRKFGYKQELQRGLSLRDLIVYGLVFMVPIAPFAIFGIVFNASHGMVPLTYLIGLVAMLFTALSYRAMSRAFPVAGSVYSYAGRGIGNSAGFIAGWAILLDYLLVPTLLYVTGAVALAAVVPAIPQSVWVVIFVVFNTVVNLAGIKITALANRAFLIGEMVILALFVVIAVIAVAQGKGGAHWSLTPFFNSGQFSLSLMFGALSIAVLSFLGFDAISTMSEEVAGESKLVGRATVLSLCMVATLFVIQTYLAALLVPGQTEFATEDAANNAFYDISGRAAGHWMLVVTAVTAALAAAVANSLVAQAATSRLLYSMARDGALPRFLSHISPRRKVPDRAVLLVAVLSLFLGLVFVGQIAFLSTLVNFGALVAFLLLHLSVAVYYLIKRRERTYGMHLVVPAVGFVIIAYVLYNADTPAKVGGLIWLAIGVILLLVRKAMGRDTTINLDEAEG
ncbi:APC family permease [Actinocrispum wychmicini]|uniref:Amino acid transporter n=1 Tax=Actinocrispum wychmicini TaxID=1213861 RepID=A0A4R2JDJ3_9PSEU|nr:APC family permease [Actinocrispum wychmicini]TCO54259.1 amino acid transporter [Actinocrispum wychmicini]